MLTLVCLQLPSLSISKSFLNTISPKYLWNIKYYYPPYITTLQTRNQDRGRGWGWSSWKIYELLICYKMADSVVKPTNGTGDAKQRIMQ